MAYTDELDAVVAAAQALRRQIALLIAADAGATPGGAPSETDLAAADAAIEAWAEEGEEVLDLRAFRPLTPLQELLVEHRGLIDRIDDIHDRRLS